MKYLLALTVSIFLLSFLSCEKVENTVPPEKAPDSIIVTNGFDYFVNASISNVGWVMHNNVDNVGNSVIREEFGACGFGDETEFMSYFAYVSDTTRKQWLGFGLTNCVHDTADGFTDSTYYVNSFSMEVPVTNEPVGFIKYMDADSNFWSSSQGINGNAAQIPHSFNVTEVIKNYDGIAALQVKGNFSGWVYNVAGDDSLLIIVSDFHTRAWKY